MRSNDLPATELQKLPYLRAVPKDGRIVPILTFWDTTAADWFLHLIVRPGELGRMAGGEVVSGSFVAVAPADAVRDFEFVLGTLVVQHISFADVLRPLDKLQSDIHRCAAILEKYQLIWRTRDAGTLSASLLVQSEVEYLMLLLRSLYDLLQEVVIGIASRLVYLDENDKCFAKELPETFRKVVMDGDELRTPEDIAKRWNLPPALANWYAGEAEFFRLLRKLRDGIAHYGSTPPTVFETAWGFAVGPDQSPWRAVHSLLPGERQPNDLASLRGLFATCVRNAITSTERLAAAIRSSVALPEPIFQDVKLFVRSPFGQRLTTLEKVVELPWEAHHKS